MEPSLIVFDIDETLYNHKKNEIPKSTVRALHKLAEAGHKLAIATGRSPFDITDNIRKLPFDFFIAHNGQYVFRKEKVLYEKALDPTLVNDLAAMARADGIPVGFLSTTRSTLSMANEAISRAFIAYELTLPEIQTDVSVTEPIYQMWIFTEEYEKYAQTFGSQVRFIPWRKYGADIIPSDGSKAKGLKKVREILTDLPEKVIFFGDGMNDLELIEMADIGVAMGNGAHEVRKRADFVTLSIDDDGIYYACEHLGLFETSITQETLHLIKELENQIKTDPQNLEHYFKLKQIYSSQLKSPEQAVTTLEDALDQHPEDVVLLAEIASVYEFELEDYKQAKLYYEKVLDVEPDHRIALDALDVLNDQNIHGNLS